MQSKLKKENMKKKKMSEAKKRKLQKWVDWMMAKGVKDKGRCKKPAMTNNYVPLTYLQYTDRDYSTSTSLYATNYTNAQNAGNTQAGGGGVTNTESYDQTYATEIE